MKDENFPPKDFDVKRGTQAPNPTSRPIIVGHHPSAGDPMVHRIKTTPPSDKPSAPEPVKVPVVDASEPAVNTETSTKKVIQPLNPVIQAAPEPTPSVEPEPKNEPAQQPVGVVEDKPPSPQTPAEAAAKVIEEAPESKKTSQTQVSEDMKVHLPTGSATRNTSRFIWVILTIVAVISGVAVAYLFFK